MLLGGCGKEIESVVPETPVQEIKPIENVSEERVRVEIYTSSREHTVHAEDGTVLMSSILRYPEICIPDAPETEKVITEMFASLKEADAGQVKEYEEEAVYHYQQVKEAGTGFFSEYAMDREYAVAYQSDSLLSIRGFMYYYTGGAHPGTVIQTWNLDLETGEEKKLMDLAEEPEQLKECLIEKIHAELESREIEAGVSLIEGLFPEYPELIESAMQDPVWYVKEGNLWIVFNEYEIAPYVAGVIEVGIPLEELQEYWNEAGQELFEVQ